MMMMMILALTIFGCRILFPGLILFFCFSPTYILYLTLIEFLEKIFAVVFCFVFFIFIHILPTKKKYMCNIFWTGESRRHTKKIQNVYHVQESNFISIYRLDFQINSNWKFKFQTTKSINIQIMTNFVCLSMCVYEIIDQTNIK